jgi:homocysteine S-methyltransferase
MMDDRDLTGPVPFWISCVFPGDDDVLALPDGTPVEEVVRAMLSVEVAGVTPWGIGINCTKVTKLPALVERYEVIVRQMIRTGELSGWPSLVLYPDGTNGEIYNTTTQKWEMPEGKERPEVSHTLFTSVHIDTPLFDRPTVS